MIYDLMVSIPTRIKTGDVLNCPYSGTYKQITLPKGIYKLEVWGASCLYNTTSTTSYNGRGGYSFGTIELKNKTNFFLYSGEQGPSNREAFNGGSYTSSNYSGYAGGGASDIRIGYDSLYSRVIVAGGGGGGSSSYGAGGYGGGLTGGSGYVSSYMASGGTQTSGGTNSSSSISSGTFGVGGRGESYGMGYGGGGWYGGAGGYFGAGGGGSGYVYTSSTASNYPSGCLLNSSYYLTDASTVSGITSFSSPSGTSEIGHVGNGYCRITVIKAGINVIYETLGGNEVKPSYDSSDNQIVSNGSIKSDKITTLPITFHFTDDGYKKIMSYNKIIKYQFKEWNTKEDGTGAKYEIGTNLSTLDIDELILYAIYDEKESFETIQTPPLQVVLPFIKDNYSLVGYSLQSFNSTNNIIKLGSSLIPDKQYDDLYLVQVRNRVEYYPNGLTNIIFNNQLKNKNNNLTILNNNNSSKKFIKFATVYLKDIDDNLLGTLYSYKIANISLSNWNTKIDNSGVSYQKNSSFSEDTYLKLYANYSTEINNTNTSVKLPTKLIKFNKKLKGWGKTKDATTNLLSGDYTPTGDIILYAIFEQ